MPLFEELDFLRDEEPHGAALNMAIDEMLLRTIEFPTLRVYRWARPALSFGYFVPFAEIQPLAAGRELVRRWTGGGIVPHGQDFTFSVIVPQTHAVAKLSPPECYRLMHQAVAEALGGGELAPATAEKVSESCFENPAESDVIFNGCKVAGGAQRRTAHGMLHQGSIQLPGLPLDFGERMAATLSDAAANYAVDESVLCAAGKLAGEKYATTEWLCRR